jgi:hypothetical protein
MTRQELDLERATGSLVIDLTRATLAEGDDMEYTDGDTDSGINRDATSSPANQFPASERKNLQMAHKDDQSASATNNRLPPTVPCASEVETDTFVFHDDSAERPTMNDVNCQAGNETGSTSSDSDDIRSIGDCSCNGNDRSHAVGSVFSAMSTEARQALTEFWIDVQRKQHRKSCSALSRGRQQPASSTADFNGTVEHEQQQRQAIKHRRLRTAGSVERRHFTSALSRDHKQGANVNSRRNECNVRRPASSLPMRRRPLPGESTWGIESSSSVAAVGYRQVQRPKSETAQRRRPEAITRPMTSHALNRHLDRSQISVDCNNEDMYLSSLNENGERRVTSSSDAGVFRITPATYDSRYEDMAVTSALDEEWRRRGFETGVPRRWNDVEEEHMEQSVVIAKCTAWLTNLQQYKPLQYRKRMISTTYD